MLPTEANATLVVIHGAFMFINENGGYSNAACGYMYFRCPAGSETMCRMQWHDIQTMGVGADTCAGFGAHNVVSAARVRTEGTALSAPDTWELGVGVQPGSYIDGKCVPARSLACALPWSVDGGVADVPLSMDTWTTMDDPVDGSAERVSPSPIDAAPIDVLPKPVDAAPIDMLPKPDAILVTKDASPDVATSGAEIKSNGCSYRSGDAGANTREHVPVALALLVGLLGAVAIRRTRR
jgi:MYXO-CTERM domain-containing protein